MAKAEVLPVGLDEIEAIAAIVRQADRDEIEGALGVPIAHALREGITGSEKVSKVVINGKVVAVFGDAVHSILGGIGSAWLISTVHITEHPRAFLQVCKPEVADMLTRHHQLMNFVDVRNTAAVRWLKWLGFAFAEPVPYGLHGEPFYPFYLSRS